MTADWGWPAYSALVMLLSAGVPTEDVSGYWLIILMLMAVSAVAGYMLASFDGAERRLERECRRLQHNKEIAALEAEAWQGFVQAAQDMQRRLAEYAQRLDREEWARRDRMGG